MRSRDPVARQPAYRAGWLLLAAAFTVALFGPLWIAGILLASSLAAYGLAWRRAHRGNADRRLS
jgi:hypothetical protein